MIFLSGKDRARFVAMLVLGIGFVLACGNVTVVENGQQPGGVQATSVIVPTIPSETQVPDPEGQDTDSDRIAGAADKCPKEPENYNKVFDEDGCPDNGIAELMDVGGDYIHEYWVAEFKEAGEQYDPPQEVVPYTSEINTACGPAVLNNAFYCPNSHGIYYDLNFLQEQLDSDGDFAPVTILAHEWGHLVQSNLGLLTSGLYSIQLELQADCFAGAWAAYAGEIGVLDPGDLEEGATALFKAGDDINTAWFDPRAHGQPEQRIEAFQKGLKQGSDVCFEQ